MDFLKALLKILDTKMEIPTSYGWFHLTFFFLSVASGVLLCFIPKMREGKTVRNFVLLTSVICILLEVYKQVNFCTSYSGETVTFALLYYSLPFQFCSIPMYAGLLSGIFRKGRVNESLLAFLATYSVFGGLCVMFYPTQVFIDTVGINIQTMFCHGAMITMGIYLFGTGTVKAEHKTVLKAIPVFVSAIVIAMALNEIVYYAGVPEGDSFNMFYISRHYDSTLPVYSLVHAALPYPLALIVYILVFTLAAYVILLVAMGISRLIRATVKRKIKNTI